MVRWGLGLIFLTSLAYASNGAKFSAPLSEPMVPIFVSPDPNIPFGQCSGTILNNIPQIITAAHCFLANLRFVRLDEVRIGLFGKRFIPIKIEVHPLYEKLKQQEWELTRKNDRVTKLDGEADRYDVAVVTLAENTPIPAWVPLAPEAPEVDKPVKEAEWGFVWPPGDYDGDRVENNADFCFTGVREKKIDRVQQQKIIRTGKNAGCEKEGKNFPYPDWGWDLRYGPNRIAEAPSKGLLITQRKIPTSIDNKEDWEKWNAKVTPGANGSGGSLFDFWGSLAGVVKGSQLVKKKGNWYLIGIFVDLNEEVNAKFLKTALARATYRKEFDDKTNYSFPTYPFLQLDLEPEDEDEGGEN